MITNQQLANAILELKEAQKETDRQLKETDKQMKETDKEIKKLADYIGSIGRNQGYVAEEFFINSISSNNMELGGIVYDELNKNMSKKTKKAEGEFDIVLVNGKDIAIIETKYKTHQNDIEKFINKKYKNFKILYPQYNNYKHHLAIATFYIDDETKEFALNNNLMVLQRKGDIVETLLP